MPKCYRPVTANRTHAEEVKTRQMKTHIAIITGIATLVGMAVAAYIHLDTIHAKAADLIMLSERVEQNEKAQLKRDIKTEIYFLRAQIRKYPDDAELKDQLDKAIEDLKEAVKEVK